MMWLNNCKGYFTPIERRFLGKMGLIIPLDADSDGAIRQMIAMILMMKSTLEL